MIAALPIAALAIAALVALSLRANRRFASLERLPMQWGLKGQVNWTAPRKVALAFTPLLGTLVLGGMALLLAFGPPPREGEEAWAVAGLAFAAVMFVGVHLLHLWLIGRLEGR